MAWLELGGNAPAFGNRRRGAAHAAPASFTMTQLSSANRIYQRSTKAGGGQGKGQGSIPVTINVSATGTVFARRRRLSDSAILQPSWLVTTVTTTGSQLVNIAGVDAGLESFALDLSGDGVSWVNGTTPVAMGSLIFACGQSHIAGMFIKSVAAGDSSTISGNGLSVAAQGRIFAVDGTSGVPSTWDQPSDAGSWNSAGVVELTNRLIAQTGVAIGVVSRHQGNTRLDEWLPGTGRHTDLLATIAAAGSRCEAFILGIGHNDAQYNYTAFDMILANLTAFWASVDTALGSAATYKKLMFGVPNLTADAYNTSRVTRMKVNGAYEDWAAANNATFLSVQDIPLGTDHVHPTQPGNIRYARHFYRGARGAVGLSGDDRGPKIVGVNKSGLNLSLPVNHQSGATALVAQGNPASRFWIARRGSPTALGLDGTTPLTVNAADLLFKLAADPGNVPIEVLPMALHPADDASADMIYDNHVDGDGIAQGRALYASPWGFDTRPKGDLTMTGATYATTAFGGGLSAGYAEAPFPVMPGTGRGSTIEFVYKHLVNVAAHKTICAQQGAFWLTVNNGQLVLSGSTLPGTLIVGQTYRIALVFLPGNKNFLLFVNGIPTAISGSPLTDSIANNFTIRRFAPGNASYDMGTTGEVAHTAIFAGARYLTAFTPSAVEYTGDEANLLHLWKLQGSGADAII